MNRASLIAVLLLAGCINGCGGNVYLLGANELDESRVAMIMKPNEDSLGFYYKITTVMSVDGEYTGYKLGDSLLHVPSGERTLGVKYSAKDKLFSFRRAGADVSFVAKAGKTYKAASKEDLASVSFWIEDVTTGDRVSDIVEGEITVISDADFTP